MAGKFTEKELDQLNQELMDIDQDNLRFSEAFDAVRAENRELRKQLDQANRQLEALRPPAPVAAARKFASPPNSDQNEGVDAPPPKKPIYGRATKRSLVSPLSANSFRSKLKAEEEKQKEK